MAQTPGVSVRALLDSRPETCGLPLEVLAGHEGLGRVITSPHIQKTGLALAGFHEFLKPGRVLIFGESEIRYLENLEMSARGAALRLALTLDFPCVLITGGFSPPAELLEESERAKLPLLKTPIATPTAIGKLTSILEDTLAERTVMHAVLMDILGLGVLIVGESGIGKSECALDLIVRGHRLVADDTVEIRRRAETILIGTCPELTRHHMELRGLGLINIEDLFGIASTRSSKRVELVVQLERWDPTREYERLGLDDDFYEILGLGVPQIRMPVAPGRNIAILVEVAARNQLLRSRGRHAARLFANRLERRLRQDGVSPGQPGVPAGPGAGSPGDPRAGTFGHTGNPADSRDRRDAGDPGHPGDDEEDEELGAGRSR
jgi:HPr kinase/phosphorylase